MHTDSTMPLPSATLASLAAKAAAHALAVEPGIEGFINPKTEVDGSAGLRLGITSVPGVKATRARRPVAASPTWARASEARVGQCAVAGSRPPHGQAWEEAASLVLAVSALGALLICALQALNSVAAW
jgi:hypothetical protein